MAESHAVRVIRTGHPSVLSIKVSELRYDFDHPWKRERETARGSALVIGPTLLLTTARLVEDSSLTASDEGATGFVTAINYDLDLALIQLQPEDAYGLVPLELGGMVAEGDEVVFHGFNDAEMTELAKVDGIVTKIEVQRCSNSIRHFLLASVRFFDLLQGSGGVLVGNKLVGLCIQRLKDDDDLFEMVPAPLIRHFLAGSRELPSLGLTTQNTSNALLRRTLGLSEDEGGLLVIDLDHGSPAEAKLQRDDVILAIDGHEIARNGTAAYGATRVRYDFMLGTHDIGDVLELVIKRNGQRMTAQLPLGRWQPLVPRHRQGTAPLYLVFAGFIFQRLTRDYLTTWNDWWDQGPKEFLDLYYRGHTTPAQQEVIVLTSILEDPLTTGYAHLYNESVRTVNGVVPKTFAEFTTLLATATGIVRLEMSSDGIILLDAEHARRETPRICAVHGIARDRTPNLPR